MNIAIVGATGLVGRKIIKLCEEFFDTSVEFQLFASKTSEGKILSVNDQDIEIGSQTYSGTYTFPLKNGYSSTNSISYSRSDFVEFEDDLKTMRFDSLTFLFQLDKSLVEKPNKNLSSIFGLNISNSESFLAALSLF